MARTLRASELNNRITIQQKGRTEDDAGYPIPNPKDWEDVMTIWAGRRPLRGREYFAASAVQKENTVLFTIRYRKGISPYMRVICDGRIYDIYAVLDDVHDDRAETHLLTTEVV